MYLRRALYIWLVSRFKKKYSLAENSLFGMVARTAILLLVTELTAYHWVAELYLSASHWLAEYRSS